MQLTDDNGRVLASWDPAGHPYWPPVDGDGQIIGDLPWRFFDPPEVTPA